MLPILHLNSFKIANPTIFGSMSDTKLHALFTGYGYDLRIVSLSDQVDADMDEAMRWTYGEIRALQQAARSGRTVDVPNGR